MVLIVERFRAIRQAMNLSAEEVERSRHPKECVLPSEIARPLQMLNGLLTMSYSQCEFSLFNENLILERDIGQIARQIVTVANFPAYFDADSSPIFSGSKVAIVAVDF